MYVYLRCKSLEPDVVQKLAELFGFRLKDEPTKIMVANLTKGDFSEEEVWKVDEKTIIVVAKRKTEYAYVDKKDKFPIARYERKRALIDGQIYAIGLMTFSLKCFHQESIKGGVANG